MTATTDLAAHLDTRLADLTPVQRTIAGANLLAECALLNAQRTTSQDAWVHAVDKACAEAAVS